MRAIILALFFAAAPVSQGTDQVLFNAACNLYGSGCEIAPPAIKLVPMEFMWERYCKGQCRVEIWGLYDDGDGGVVYIYDQLRDSPIRDSVIVHEMVHYLQHVKGYPTGGCAREAQAYYLGDKYLIQYRGIIPPPRGPVC